MKKQRPKAATSTTVQGSRTNDETIGNNNVIARLKRQRVIKEVRVEGSKRAIDR